MISPLSILSPFGSSGSSWTPQKIADTFLFYGEVSKITGGRLNNQVTGSSDYLTVGGSAGSETYQAPNTSPYKTADADLLWFSNDNSQETITKSRLVNWNYSRTLIDFNGDTPYDIVKIGILRSDLTLTQSLIDKLSTLFRLWFLWDGTGTPNEYGYGKDNRTPAPTIPYIVQANVLTASPTIVTLTFSEALDEGSVPAPSAFALAGKTITNVSVTGVYVVLTVSVAYVFGNSITCVYTKPSGNWLQSLYAGIIPSFSQSVTNSISNPILFLDHFTDTTNVKLNAHTPDSGAGWTAPDQLIISSNKLQCNGTGATHYVGLVEVGVADIDQTVKINCAYASGGAQRYSTVFFRAHAYNDGWMILINREPGPAWSVFLNKDNVQVGVTKHIWQFVDGWYTIRVRAVGNSIKVYCDAPTTDGTTFDLTPWWDITDATHNNYTKHGLGAWRNASYQMSDLDDYQINTPS